MNPLDILYSDSHMKTSNTPHCDQHVDYRIDTPFKVPVERKRRVLPRQISIETECHNENLQAWLDYLAQCDANKNVQLDRHARRASRPDVSSKGCSVHELCAIMLELLAPKFPPGSTAEAEKSDDTVVTDIPLSIASLGVALLAAETNMMQNLLEVTLYEDTTVDIRNELFHLHLVRRHRNGNRNNKKSIAQAKQNANKAKQRGQPITPSQMIPYLPAPDIAPPNPNDEPDATNVRRCVVGRPRGKLLRQGRDRYWIRYLCDKHGSETLLEESMRFKGGFRDRKEAWRCC
jgi:hypothetical protein